MEASVDQIQVTFEKQQQFLRENEYFDLNWRLSKLAKLKEVVLKNEGRICDALNQDFKKPSFEGRLSEVLPLISEINIYQKKLASWIKDKPVKTSLSLSGTKSSIHYERKGHCLIIAPWNYPFLLGMVPIVNAIGAGNIVCLKPSELTRNTAYVMESIIKEVFEAEEVSVIQGGVAASTELLKKPFDHIFFTGSTRVGKIIMSAAAENLASVTLELGGKSPVLVDSSCDLKKAAQKIIWGKFLNAGQTCVAPDYLLVDSKIKDDLIFELKAVLKDLYLEERKDDLAGIVSEGHYNRLVSMIEEAKNRGGQIITGGESDHESHRIQPCLILNPPLNCSLMKEEIFGPILPIIEMDSLDEMIEMTKEWPKPLASYLFIDSNETEKIEKFVNGIPSGGSCINDTVVHLANHYLPFGGSGGSGMGRYHGHHGFLEFSHQRAILKRNFDFTFNKIKAPYNDKKHRFLDTLLGKLSNWV